MGSNPAVNKEMKAKNFKNINFFLNSSRWIFAPVSSGLRSVDRPRQRQLRREARPQHQGQPGERRPVDPVPPDRNGDDHHQVGKVSQQTFFAQFYLGGDLNLDYSFNVLIMKKLRTDSEIS